ncbi:response regulator [Nocardioides sp. dk4132]|uniref:response regulator n=1 Tax=unclassified Nocardioides TaxID=2615069 RepID=UPI0012968B1B|nr:MULTISPECIES: response regulator [unclassified Nocardioides]MQW75409.1 response regulator [Nocardioides sp. dk4132]QGA08333.1 response regulator [Nocardioides sp. dk884]
MSTDRPDTPIRVVLVDDAVDTRRVVRLALRLRGGFEVLAETGSGEEAVALVRRLQPDVVVLDLGLPDLAGRAVLTQAREAAPDVQVVVFSGADPHAADAAWYEQHTAGYVVKNEDVDYLVDLLVAAARPTPASPSATAEVDLPQDLSSVREARSLVRSTLATWDLEHLHDEACLVVSELATNALNHAQSSFCVRLRLNPTTVRIEVGDGGRGTPEPQPHSATREGGRGMLLVAAMSASWGIDRSDDGKVVWAELARETAGHLAP